MSAPVPMQRQRPPEGNPLVILMLPFLGKPNRLRCQFESYLFA